MLHNHKFQHQLQLLQRQQQISRFLAFNAAGDKWSKKVEEEERES